MPVNFDYDDETNDIEVERDNPSDVTFTDYDFSIFSREYNPGMRNTLSFDRNYS